MKLLITSDWHLDSEPRNGYRWGAVEEVRRAAAAHAVDAVAMLGDITNSANHHSGALVNGIVEALNRFGVPVYVLRGNHDSDGEHFFRFLNISHQLRYLDAPETIRLDGISVGFYPYGMWPPRLPDNIDLAFAHETFTGALAENDQMLRGERLPMNGPQVYCGDVHVPQRQGPVTYVGAPTHIRFGDKFAPRVIVLDTEARSYQSLPLRGPTKQLVRVTAHADGSLDWGEVPIGPHDVVKVEVRFSGALPPIGHLRADIAAGIEARGAVLAAIEPKTEKRSGPLPTSAAPRDDATLVRQYAGSRRFADAVTEAGLAIVEERA